MGGVWLSHSYAGAGLSLDAGQISKLGNRVPDDRLAIWLRSHYVNPALPVKAISI